MNPNIPRTITIFLATGNPNGIKKLEISNRIIRAYVMPRLRIAEAKEHTDLTQPALYILFDKEATKAYIGESENFYERIKSHDQGKDFWDVAVAFIAKDKSLEKGDIKYLESLAVEKSKDAGRIETANKTIPPRNNLHEFKVPTILEFFNDVSLLTATLGFPIFEKIETANVGEEDIWYCKGRKTSARGILGDSGFKVLAGSLIDATNVPSFDAAERMQLLSVNSRRFSDEQYELTHDVTFPSVSRASSFCLGRPSNGWKDWKNKDGKTMDELLRKGQA
jgi:hypothetical protein